MPPHQHEHNKAFYEELARIVNLCQSIRTKSDDPFLVDVPQKLAILKKLLPKWKALDELLMDAEALNELSLMVKLQSDWVRRRATGLFIDPFLIEVKVKMLSKEHLASALLSSWRPLIASDQLTPRRLAQAIEYWKVLLPLSQRMAEAEPVQETEQKVMTVSDLIRLKFLSDKVFNEEVRGIEAELVRSAGGAPVDYWSFVIRDTYDETVMRAYALSFLISNGHADLIINPVEETIDIAPVTGPALKKAGKSVPISIPYEKWMEMRGRGKISPAGGPEPAPGTGAGGGCPPGAGSGRGGMDSEEGEGTIT